MWLARALGREDLRIIRASSLTDTFFRPFSSGEITQVVVDHHHAKDTAAWDAIDYLRARSIDVIMYPT